jgi:hypothetical protein
MKGDTNYPGMAIDGTCDICGNHVDNYDGDTCDGCGNWACYECGTHFDKGWLCPSCAEKYKQESMAEPDDGYDEDLAYADFLAAWLKDEGEPF